MAKTRKLAKTKKIQAPVPVTMYDQLMKQMFYTIYTTHVDYKPIYEMIRDNPELTLRKIQYLLKPLGYNRSISGLRDIARTCDLPYKE